MTEKDTEKNEPFEDIDYMDVKAASEVMEELRNRTRRMLRDYRRWRRRYEDALLKSSHLLMTDDLLRGQLSSMYGMYRTTNGEFHKLYRKSVAIHAANDRRRWQPEAAKEAGR